MTYFLTFVDSLMKKDVLKGQIMKKLEFDCKAKDDQARRLELNNPDVIILAARFWVWYTDNFLYFW